MSMQLSNNSQELSNTSGEWSLVFPDNFPLVTAKLEDRIIQHLWDDIDLAKKNIKENKHNSRLAGNLSESLVLSDHNNILEDYLREPCTLYVSDFLMSSPVNRNIFMEQEDHSAKLTLASLWVNHQKQHEFNPLHHHSGVVSFVIWLKIPTDYRDQHLLPFVANSNLPSASNFEVLYSRIDGSLATHAFFLDEKAEGQILMFPSNLMHQVYPFYHCDEERVSISGNLYYEKLSND